jgi:hypothetical protein
MNERLSPRFFLHEFAAAEHLNEKGRRQIPAS